MSPFFCGGKEIRTPDPLHAMQVLYQLSYTPKGTSMLPVTELPTISTSIGIY
jgi:hypothetical protein